MINSKSKNQIYLHLMLLPSVIVLLIFSYRPMLGFIMAFQKYYPAKGLLGSEWVGLDNIRYVLDTPGFYTALFNTLFIAGLKIITGLIVPVVIALLLNEVNNTFVKKGVQTLTYLPHFLSWVILAGIFIDILSPTDGIVNRVLQAMGMEPVYFLGDPKWFPYTMVITNIWKEAGWGAIIYLASITSIDQGLYEASWIDGAGRIRQTIHVTLPGMGPIIILMTVLSIGGILDAGFDQIFNMYSPSVYSTGDVIGTLMYRLGLVDMQYGVSTAVSLFNSTISLILIAFSYKLANKFSGYRVF